MKLLSYFQFLPSFSPFILKIVEKYDKKTLKASGWTPQITHMHASLFTATRLTPQYRTRKNGRKLRFFVPFLYYFFYKKPSFLMYIIKCFILFCRKRLWLIYIYKFRRCRYFQSLNQILLSRSFWAWFSNFFVYFLFILLIFFKNMFWRRRIIWGFRINFVNYASIHLKKISF